MNTDQLANIEARAQDCQSYNFGMRNADKLAKEDVPALLALVREQALQLEGLRTGMQDAMADAWDEGHNHYGKFFSPNFAEFGVNPYRAITGPSA